MTAVAFGVDSSDQESSTPEVKVSRLAPSSDHYAHVSDDTRGISRRSSTQG